MWSGSTIDSSEQQSRFRDGGVSPANFTPHSFQHAHSDAQHSRWAVRFWISKVPRDAQSGGTQTNRTSAGKFRALCAGLSSAVLFAAPPDLLATPPIQLETGNGGSVARQNSEVLEVLAGVDAERHWRFAVDAFSSRKPSLAVAHLGKLLRIAPNHHLAGRMLLGILAETVFPEWHGPLWRLEARASGDASSEEDGNASGEITDIQLSLDGARALVLCAKEPDHERPRFGLDESRGRVLLIETRTGKTLVDVSRLDPHSQYHALSRDGQYVFGLEAKETARKPPRVFLKTSVRVSDGVLLEDVRGLAKAREAEIKVVTAGYGQEKTPLARGVTRTAGGYKIKQNNIDGFRTIACERMDGSWLSPDKRWLFFNGVNGTSRNAWTYRLDYMGVSFALGETWDLQNVTFDPSTSFVSKNIWSAEYEGYGLASVERLWPDDRAGSSSITQLELPIMGPIYASVIGQTGLLAVSASGGRLAVFDLPAAPVEVEPRFCVKNSGVSIDQVATYSPKVDRTLSGSELANFVENQFGIALEIKDSDQVTEPEEAFNSARILNESRCDVLLLLFGNRLVFGRAGNPEVVTWQLPEAFRDLSLFDWPRVLSLVLDDSRVVLMNAGNGSLALFEAGQKEAVTEQSVDLDRADPRDQRKTSERWLALSCLKTTSEILVTARDGFSVFDASTLKETTRCRTSFESSVPLYLSGSSDLLVDAEVLAIAEQTGGWKIGGEGRAEPMDYSEERSAATAQRLKSGVARVVETKAGAVSKGIAALDEGGHPLLLIPGGSCRLGPDEETRGMTESAVDYEHRLARWRILDLRAFFIGETEVTYGEWRRVLDWARVNGYEFENLGEGISSDHPVAMVNWYDVVKWTNAKSEKEGLRPCYFVGVGRCSSDVYRTGNVELEETMVDWEASGYRLPTEAEWKRAALGSSGEYPESMDANTGRGFRWEFWTYGRTQKVKSHTPNKHGLYDMAGNVEEWCWDPSPLPDGKLNRGRQAGGKHRVTRGGSWFRGDLSSSFSLPPDSVRECGFRVVRRGKD